MGVSLYKTPAFQLTGCSLWSSSTPAIIGWPLLLKRPGAGLVADVGTVMSGSSEVSHQSCRMPARTLNRSVTSIWSVA